MTDHIITAGLLGKTSAYAENKSGSPLTPKTDGVGPVAFASSSSSSSSSSTTTTTTTATIAPMTTTTTTTTTTKDKPKKNKNRKRSQKARWTQEEDKLLRALVKENDAKNWKKICESFPERTDVQCLHRWQKVLNPNLIKVRLFVVGIVGDVALEHYRCLSTHPHSLGFFFSFEPESSRFLFFFFSFLSFLSTQKKNKQGPWTPEEDAKVKALVKELGPKKWSIIASNLPGRIGKQCRERWHNHLNPLIRKDSWSPAEGTLSLLK